MPHGGVAFLRASWLVELACRQPRLLPRSPLAKTGEHQMHSACRTVASEESLQDSPGCGISLCDYAPWLAILAKCPVRYICAGNVADYKISLLFPHLSPPIHARLACSIHHSTFSHPYLGLKICERCICSPLHTSYAKRDPRRARPFSTVNS
jgi:hypothetical protein